MSVTNAAVVMLQLLSLLMFSLNSDQIFLLSLSLHFLSSMVFVFWHVDLVENLNWAVKDLYGQANRCNIIDAVLSHLLLI